VFALHGGGRAANIAARSGAAPAQIALACASRALSDDAPDPGTLSLGHLKENVAALTIELSDAEYQALLLRRETFQSRMTGVSRS
jgi:aryl-alcohol dehydrogenase-like predicted oxidoreductase